MSDDTDQFEREFARRLSELSATPLPGQYSVDEVVGKSASGRRTHSTILLLAATMGAVVVGGGLVAVSGMGGGTNAGDVGSDGSTPASVASVACDPALFVRQLRVVVYDYEPANSPRELAAQADLVVSGVIMSVDAASTGGDRGADTLMTIAVDDVLRGNSGLITDGRVHVVVPGDATAMNTRDVAGCQVVLFLDDRGARSREGLPQGAHAFSPFVQGFWIESGSAMVGVYAELDDSPAGWHGIETIDDLMRAITDRYTSSIAGRLAPRMGAQQVADFVTARLASTKEGNAPLFDGVIIDIISVDAMTLADATSANGAEVGQEGDQIVCLVTADGPFLSYRGRGPDPLVGTSGYYVRGDATGEILASGFSAAR